MENFYLKAVLFIVLGVGSMLANAFLAHFQNLAVNILNLVAIPGLYVLVFAFTDKLVELVSKR